MPARPFLIVRTSDQWMRSSHVRTALDREHGILQLADAPEERAATVAPAPALYAGLAFDRECRLYRATPHGQIFKYLWAAFTADARRQQRPDGTPLFDEPKPGPSDEFATEPAPVLSETRALAVDADGRLFVADASSRSVAVIDLARRRVLRHVQFAPGEDGAIAQPIDLASSGRRIYVLLDNPVGIAMVRARRPVRHVPLPAVAALTTPARLTVGRDGRLCILENAGLSTARVIVFHPVQPARVAIFPEPFATDLEFDGSGALVIARHPGDTFERVKDTSIWEKTSELQATGFDGSGIVRAPDGRIGFWTTAGTFRHAIPARPHYVSDGRVTTYRLDSGTYQTVWGRLFVDACIPRGTSMRVRAVASDEPPEGPTVPADLPSNVDASKVEIHRRDLSPLLPRELDAGPIDGALFERPRGRELPWSFQDTDDRFETYEAPVRADRGRFLWVTLELRGTGRQTPRVRSLRVEHPAHDYLQRLPKTFSRDAAAESFLRRFLAPIEGVFGEFESRAIARMVLVDARSAPQDVLPWLAGFAGLVLDERLQPDRKRRLVGEAVPLLRMRGTVRGLRRFIDLAIGITPHIIEHFTLRGFGGPVLGYTGADAPTRSVLGSGFRIGGALDSGVERPLEGEPIDVIRRRAHRFTVILPANPSSDERGILDHILEIHRPAHTIASYCTAEAGMRAGVGLHLGLTTVVGDTGRFVPAMLGNFALGRGTTLGHAVAGALPGASRLGLDMRVG